MKTIYNAAHGAHQAEYEFFRGEKVPAFEKPERADWVHAAVQRAGLGDIVPPQVAAVLNVGTAHVGEFGGKEQIAVAKGEIVEALPADGTAVTIST